MNELIANIHKLHTTELGAERVRRNLDLSQSDIVSWCKDAIENPKCSILRKGKNWYVLLDDCQITVNARSYTIITAHKIKNKPKASTNNVSTFEIRYVSKTDKAFWFTIDEHMSEAEFLLKVRDKRGYIISDGDRPIGVMRYNLFWDNLPFLTLIHLEEFYLGKGFGKQAMLFWEDEMRELGYKMVMTSTQVDEQAQHFYRKLGYIEKGCISFDNTPLEQPLEMFLLKTLLG